jgi:hypothetical protein
VMGTELLHERWPDKATREPDARTTVPIQDIMERGEREELVRKRIVYNYTPLVVLAVVLCFITLVWAVAFTVESLSNNQTARACFAAGNEWKMTDQGARECTKP